MSQVGTYVIDVLLLVVQHKHVERAQGGVEAVGA